MELVLPIYNTHLNFSPQKFEQKVHIIDANYGTLKTPHPGNALCSPAIKLVLHGLFLSCGNTPSY